MAKRISSLKPGEAVRLRFHGSKQFGNEPYELDLIFERIEGVGDDARAHFTDPSGPDFEAYRDRGRWAYGMSSERLSIAS